MTQDKPVGDKVRNIATFTASIIVIAAFLSGAGWTGYRYTEYQDDIKEYQNNQRTNARLWDECVSQVASNKEYVKNNPGKVAPYVDSCTQRDNPKPEFTLL